MGQAKETLNPVGAFTAGEDLLAFRRVAWSADDTVVYADAGQVGIGTVANENVLNAGRVSIRLNNSPGTRKVVASGAITVGAVIYGDDDGKVTATVTGKPIGRALDAASANLDVIEAEWFDQGGAGGVAMSYASAADSSTLTNSTTETILNTATVVQAGTLKVGSRIKFRGAIKVPSTNSTDTLTARIRMGGIAGTAVAATAAVNATNSDIVYIEGEMVVRTIGASGTAVFIGIYINGVPGTAVATPLTTTEFTVDTTADQTFTLTAQWSVANASNQCASHAFTMEHVAPAA